jgi:lipid-A-disaccharide synthase
LCIVVSGTATLHVAALGTPMIVVYRVNPVTWHLAGRWMVPARTFALVNVLSERSGVGTGRVVPEFVPWLGSDQPVADLAIRLLQHPEEVAAQRAKIRELINTLNRPGASDHVAKIAMEMMQRPDG